MKQAEYYDEQLGILMLRFVFANVAHVRRFISLDPNIRRCMM